MDYSLVSNSVTQSLCCPLVADTRDHLIIIIYILLIPHLIFTPLLLFITRISPKHTHMHTHIHTHRTYRHALVGEMSETGAVHQSVTLSLNRDSPTWASSVHWLMWKDHKMQLKGQLKGQKKIISSPLSWGYFVTHYLICCFSHTEPLLKRQSLSMRKWLSGFSGLNAPRGQLMILYWSTGRNLNHILCRNYCNCNYIAASSFQHCYMKS